MIRVQTTARNWGVEWPGEFRDQYGEDLVRFNGGPWIASSIGPWANWRARALAIRLGGECLLPPVGHPWDMIRNRDSALACVERE